MSRWWLRLARERVAKESGSLKDLGKRLQAHAGRSKPWTHTSLSNFVAGREPVTLELARALSKEYRLPPPVHFCRSYNEALEILFVIEKYDELIAPDDEDALPELPGEIVEMPRERKPRPRKQAPITVGEWTKIHGHGSVKKSG